MISFKQFLKEGINDKGIFKAVFLGGNPGAGKSYVNDKISSGSIQPRVINSDKFLEFIAKKRNIDIGPGFDKEAKEFSKLFKDSKNSTRAHLEASINGMLPMIIDSTSADINNTIARNKILQDFGYDTAMIWVNTSLETSLKRAALRARSVPEAFIRKVFSKVEENKKVFRSKFSIFMEINNDDGELTDKVIIKAFNKLNSFFGSEIKNKKGKQIKEQLMKELGKELVPNIMSKSELSSKISIWFKKG